MTSQKSYISADEFLTLVHQPEYADRSLELVDGEIYEGPKPSWKHGLLTVRMALAIAAFVYENDFGEVVVADTGFLLSNSSSGAHNVRSIDVAFVSNSKLQDPVEGAWLEMGPDLAIEVISPNDRADHTHQKVMQLLTAGTRLVWLVYPQSRTVVAHTAEGAKTLRGDDTLSGGDVLPGFKLRVNDIFPS